MQTQWTLQRQQAHRQADYVSTLQVMAATRQGNSHQQPDVMVV
jgi:hypothetical protein